MIKRGIFTHTDHDVADQTARFQQNHHRQGPRVLKPVKLCIVHVHQERYRIKDRYDD